VISSFIFRSPQPPPTPSIEIISGASLVGGEQGRSGELCDRALVHLLEQDLHPGEAESIALAVEMRPESSRDRGQSYRRTLQFSRHRDYRPVAAGKGRVAPIPRVEG